MGHSDISWVYFTFVFSEDICNPETNVTMCPLCDKLCDYWKLHETCFYARLTYLFDNDATVFFAIIMSLWSAVFLECWKRYSAEITHRWDLTGFDLNEEHPRPEYLVRLKNVKRKETNVITNVQVGHSKVHFNSNLSRFAHS